MKPNIILGPLGVVPDPVEVQRQIVETARTARILRRLLRISLSAREEIARRATVVAAQEATPCQR